MKDQKNSPTAGRSDCHGDTATKLKRCNRCLGGAVFLMLLSGIQLEATASAHGWTVSVHIFFGIILTVLSIRHIYLHYRFSNWLSRFARNRNISTRILWWAFLLTVVSGIAASIHWLAGNPHSPLGGIHGKIGFIMIVTAFVHIGRHTAKHKKSMLDSKA